MSVIEENKVLQINDINFIVGASSIDIQKENLSYTFKVLREKSSTKLPTGNGAAVVTISIAIPREDIVNVHRLMVQVKRNPFIYIENKFIRHSIVPHWPLNQNMAFTLGACTLESIPGNVGLFNLSLQLKWFNYFPYCHNFLFREDWKTDWIKPSEEDKELLRTLEINDVKFVKKSIYNYITDYWYSTNFPPNGFSKTFEDNFEGFSGFLFDLMPLPSGMEKSFAVSAPSESKIYKRYYNELQAEALLNNFNIDVKTILGDPSYYQLCLSGEKTLNEVLKEQNSLDLIVDKMLSYDYLKIYFNVYKFIDLPESLKTSLSENLNSVIFDVSESTAALSHDEDAMSSIPDIIKSNVSFYEKLIELNPYFRSICFSVIEKMINGDNLTGIKYIKNSPYSLKVSECGRSLNANYGSETSFHKIKSQDGNSDSFAMDLGLLNNSGLGNFLDKVQSEKELLDNHLEDARRILYFQIDYGYVVNKYFKGQLLWGGNFQKAYDKESAQAMSTRLNNVKSVLSFSEQDILFKRNESGLPPLNDWHKIVYKNLEIGIDPVHVQLYIPGDTTKVYNDLQSGWRPTYISNEYAYNDASATYKNSDGYIVPWYKALDKIAGKPLTDQDQVFFQTVTRLKDEGWTYYTKDKSINGVFTKLVEILVPSTSGAILFNDEGFMGFSDGSNNDLDTVLTKVSTSLRHVIVNIPIAGQEWPTQQHLGGIDPQFNFELVTGDRTGNQDGIGKLAQLIESVRISLQMNATNIKSIHDSWMCSVDNFVNRLMQNFSDNDLLSNIYNDKSRKNIINSTSISTIEKQPGLSVFTLQTEESLPFIGESLVKVNTVSQKNKIDIYKKIVAKAKEIGKYSNLSVNERTFLSNTGITDSIFDFLGLSISNDIRDRGKSSVYSRLVLDQTKVSDLTQEELNKLETFMLYFGNIQLLSNLILFEKEYGGMTNFGDIYGLESLIKPKGKVFLEKNLNEISPLTTGILEVLATLGIIAFTDIAFIYAAYKGGEFAGSQNPLSTLTGSETIKSYLGTTFGIIGILVALLFTPIVSAAAGTTAYSLIDLDNSSLILIPKYLKALENATGDLGAAFSVVPEIGAFYIKDFLSFDSSPLVDEQVYGLAEAIFTYLKAVKEKKTSFKLTKQEFEENKIELIKNNLINTFDQILYDPFFIEFFDIKEEVAALVKNRTMDKSQALPDLDLPVHPFWNENYLTPPDFYYYNFHEDGQYSNNQYLETSYTDMIKNNIAGVKSFYDKLEKGERLETSFGDISAGELYGIFEGSDNAPTEEFNSFLDTGLALENRIKTSGYSNINKDSGKPDTLTFDEGVNSCNFLVSNFDRDDVYLPRTTKSIISRLSTIEAQFGVKDGYANERKEIQKVFPNKNFEFSSSDTYPDSMAHFYSQETLESITSESLKDIVSQKITMKRAWPTFKLYIIEEDQTEDLIYRYDDFHHYNAIKEITIVKNKFIAADTAIIKLQNISGILDGSKRLIIKDTDYYYDNKNVFGKTTSKGKKIEEGRKPINEDTSKEEPFGAIVLRPGVNVQIRTGYGNNPNTLDVRLSGRVTDVNFSENNDLIEIIVQSFGVELEQQEKGLDPDGTERFNLTHKLLGSLMFSPELKHFGRFEKGVPAQYGEAKDYSLDFKDYNHTSLLPALTEIFTTHTSNIVNNFFEPVTGKNILAAVASPASLTYLLPATYVNFVQSSLSFSYDIVGTYSGLVYGFAKKLITNSIQEKFNYALLSPQDDNLFPPHPKDYLERPNWQIGLVKNITSDLLANGFDLSDLKKHARTVLNTLVNPRLKFNDLEYSVQNSTIFQVFHEMTLRHPGYTYAALPYGNELRYTMFFGVPSQRYWSKPAHPFFIQRVNKLRQSISSPMEDTSKVEADKIRHFYEVDTFAELSNYIKYNSLFSDGSSYYLDLTKESVNNSVNSGGDKKVFEELNIFSLQEALIEYYQSLTLRFEPFRRYHLANDKTDIISNNITLNDYNFANAVAVKYYANIDGKENEDIALVKIHDKMPEDQIKLKQIDYMNVNSKNLALRYGVGELVHEVKKMYSGSILTLGNPRMRPQDYVYIIDRYNDMAGLIEIEQIVEKISFENGYFMEITPNAVVFANEIASFPIVEGLKAVVGGIAREEARFTTNFKGNDFFNLLLTNKVSETVIDTLDFIYEGSITDGTSLQDISSYVQYNINETVGIPSTNSDLNTLQSTFMSGAWLLGGYFYLNQVSAAQSVIIYPLLKNGVPFISGIPAARPENLWSIFRGQVSLFANEVTRGSVDFLSYWKLLGVESLKALASDSKLNQSIAEGYSRSK